jgi:hypothetical protein
MALPNEAELLDKIRTLPADKIAEVEDFVEFLQQKTEAAQLSSAVSRIAEPAFKKVWDNPDDADYDQL